MTKTRTRHGYHFATEWRIDKPKLTKPVIKTAEIIDGVLYYFTNERRQFIAEVFNRIWGVPAGKIRNKFYKGKLIGHRGY